MPRAFNISESGQFNESAFPIQALEHERMHENTISNSTVMAIETAPPKSLAEHPENEDPVIQTAHELSEEIAPPEPA
jgi:hypothetical protein